MIYKTALIGLGEIGFNYDAALPYQDYTLTHFRAFQKHPNFEIIAAVDPIFNQKKVSGVDFDFPIFKKIEELFMLKNIDFFVIANPTEFHCETGFEILKSTNPTAILCEKPISNNYEEAKLFCENCTSSNVSLFINYFRRADPAFLKLKTLITKRKWEQPFQAEILYTKGLIHNGSHFLDILYFLFGKIIDVGPLKEKNFFRSNNEPIDSTTFYFNRGVSTLKHVDRYSASTPIIKCNFDDSIFEYFDNGEIIVFNKKDPKLKLNLPGNKNHYQYNVVNELYNAMQGKSHNLCDGKQALDTLYWLLKAQREN